MFVLHLKNQKKFAVPRLLVLPAILVCGCLWMTSLDPHICKGTSNWTQVCKWVQIYIFKLSYKLTFDLEPWLMTFDRMNIGRFSYYISKPSLVGGHSNMKVTYMYMYLPGTKVGGTRCKITSENGVIRCGHQKKKGGGGVFFGVDSQK